MAYNIEEDLAVRVALCDEEDGLMRFAMKQKRVPAWFALSPNVSRSFSASLRVSGAGSMGM